ncbi:hypothetical protein CF319_g5607 [Tilletia indica]|nr:hypothetical protein CF319_g5607 [Tilletia indica]
MTGDIISIRPASLERGDDHFVLTAFDSALPYLASIGSGAQWGSTPFTSKPAVVKDMHDFLVRSDKIHALEREHQDSQGVDAATAAKSVFEAESSRTQKSNWNKLIVAEVLRPNSDPNSSGQADPIKVRVAGAGLSAHVPDYLVASMSRYFPTSTTTVTPQQLQDIDIHSRENAEARDEGVEMPEGRPFVYINYLISHRDPLSLADSKTTDSTTTTTPLSAPDALALSKGAGEALIRHSISQARTLGILTVLVDCWAGNGGGLVRYYERQGFTSLGTFDVPDKHGPNLPWTGRLLRMDLD